jgi:hypothetical protein
MLILSLLFIQNKVVHNVIYYKRIDELIDQLINKKKEGRKRRDKTPN